MNESAALSDERTSDGMGSSELADTSGFIVLDYSGIAYLYCSYLPKIPPDIFLERNPTMPCQCVFASKKVPCLT